MPYFGDHDVTGVDVSYYDAVVTRDGVEIVDTLGSNDSATRVAQDGTEVPDAASAEAGTEGNAEAAPSESTVGAAKSGGFTGLGGSRGSSRLAAGEAKDERKGAAAALGRGRQVIST